MTSALGGWGTCPPEFPELAWRRSLPPWQVLNLAPPEAFPEPPASFPEGQDRDLAPQDEQPDTQDDDPVPRADGPELRRSPLECQDCRVDL